MNLEKVMAGKIIKGNLNGKKIAEQWINVNDAILIAKKYAKKMCKKQKDKSIKIFRSVHKDIPLTLILTEDARYNYPEREHKIYEGLKTASLATED